MASRKTDRTHETHDRNPDPITDEPGSHPVGTGLGAAAGGTAGGLAGAAIAGAAAGTAAGGPVGTAVGAAIGIVAGAVGGGLAGKSIAENIDPTAEDAYWRENYRGRSYVDQDASYDDYGPAYRYGWESRTRYPDRSYQEIESDLQRDWDTSRGSSRLDWDRARYASQDAWERVSSMSPTTPATNMPKKAK